MGAGCSSSARAKKSKTILGKAITEQEEADRQYKESTKAIERANSGNASYNTRSRSRSRRRGHSESDADSYVSSKQLHHGGEDAEANNSENILRTDQFVERREHDMTRRLKLEHYQPAGFPIVPVISRWTHGLTNDSWQSIVSTRYDDADSMAADGKIAGATHFYNTFFRMLFDKSPGFRNVFGNDIAKQASIMGNIIALCTSVKYETLDLTERRIKSLGIKHRMIVKDAWLYDSFASTLHNSLQHCLGDNATHAVMEAWLNVLSYVLRIMIPQAVTNDHIRELDGQVSASSAINQKAQEEIQTRSQMKSMRSKLGKGLETRSSMSQKSTDGPAVFDAHGEYAT